MTVSLKDKVAVVTGAGRGIGRASALALAREGCHLVVTSRTAGDLNTLAGEIEALGVKALAVPADAADVAGVETLRDQTLQTFGQVDILVNNAGVAKYGTLLEHTVEDYDWMMTTNVRSTFLVTRAFLPSMLERKSGSIIIVSSQAGYHGFAGETVYCATKFAQVGFAQGLDEEVRGHNIKVSVIAPGGVATTFAFGTGRYDEMPELEGMLDAEDVAEAVVFAAKQPAKSRILVVGMRPMSEKAF